MFVLKNEFFYTVIFLTELNFLKGDTNINFKQITFFEIKKGFCKNHTYFFIKNMFYFSLVLLHLNNHTRLGPDMSNDIEFLILMITVLFTCFYAHIYMII